MRNAVIYLTSYVFPIGIIIGFALSLPLQFIYAALVGPPSLSIGYGVAFLAMSIGVGVGTSYLCYCLRKWITATARPVLFNAELF